MKPKIDYGLLADALEEYQKRGYRYVEVPWFVDENAIRTTLPSHCEPIRISEHDCLVGSAEQGFVTMGLEPGAYVGVTPCFRDEAEQDLLRQITFMKVELFVVSNPGVNLESTADHVRADAFEVMALLGGARPNTVATEEGFDLEMGGIEVGSYGVREAEGYGRWVYGTGLALPRFSVANAIAKVL